MDSNLHQGRTPSTIMLKILSSATSIEAGYDAYRRRAYRHGSYHRSRGSLPPNSLNMAYRHAAIIFADNCCHRRHTLRFIFIDTLRWQIVEIYTNNDIISRVKI